MYKTFKVKHLGIYAYLNTSLFNDKGGKWDEKYL
jgi:hypothetical protein